MECCGHKKCIRRPNPILGPQVGCFLRNGVGRRYQNEVRMEKQKPFKSFNISKRVSRARNRVNFFHQKSLVSNV
jgi:hypothetical protein